MNPGGIVVVIVGIWLGCQVFAGDALERLGIIPANASTLNAPAPSAPGAVYTPPSSSRGGVVTVECRAGWCAAPWAPPAG